MIAGFIEAKTRELDIQSVLARAIAYGSAACLQAGTQAPAPSDIENIQKSVKVIKL